MPSEKPRRCKKCPGMTWNASRVCIRCLNGELPATAALGWRAAQYSAGGVPDTGPREVRVAVPTRQRCGGGVRLVAHRGDY